MSIGIIITICSLLLIAYIFDLTSKFTKVPTVIFLLFLGWAVNQLALFFNIKIPDLNPLLPILGTIGLILIVLDGALELELNKSKIPLIKKSLIISLFSLLVFSLLFGWALSYFLNLPFKVCLLNAIPLSIISSAIAIPSVRDLSSRQKEFIIYESSLSDIFGILFFNFIEINEVINAVSFLSFAFNIVIVIVLSFLSVLILAFLLSHIKHHITFTPIILLVILLYAISKVYHLPGLIFILIFGLFLGNIEIIKKNKWLMKLQTEKLNKEVHKFKEITVEATFLIRSLFFLLFGFLMEASEILNLETLPWALVIVSGIFFIRLIALKLSNLPISPLLFISPRGLITILLFLAILPKDSIPFINKSLIIQAIVISILSMMLGLMLYNKNEENTKPKEELNV